MIIIFCKGESANIHDTVATMFNLNNGEILSNYQFYMDIIYTNQDWVHAGLYSQGAILKAMTQP